MQPPAEIAKLLKTAFSNWAIDAIGIYTTHRKPSDLIFHRPGASIYEINTGEILAELQGGNVPWRKPWRVLRPANLISKKRYRGINVFLHSFEGYGSQPGQTYRTRSTASFGSSSD